MCSSSGSLSFLDIILVGIRSAKKALTSGSQRQGKLDPGWMLFLNSNTHTDVHTILSVLTVILGILKNVCKARSDAMPEISVF